MNDQSLPGSSAPVLNYSTTPFSRWPHDLQELASAGISQIQTRIFWGDHERIRGVRDFSKSSRLRLERFLTLAHEHGLEVELTAGFPVGGATFPDWTLELKTKSTLFHSIWDSEARGMNLVQIPAFEDGDLAEGFADYIAELLATVALYRKPEGPVTRVRIDLGLGLGSLGSVGSTGLTASLLHRYEKIEWLNQIFGTNFRDFKAVATPQGIRVLGDRRPWLTAYEYKWAQHYVLTGIIEQIRGLPEAKVLEEIIEVDPYPPTSLVPNENPWEILMDGVLVGESPLGTYPWAPDGFIKGPALMAYRLNRYLAERCEENSVRFDLLPFKRETRLQAPLVVIICGKYLSDEHRRALEVYVEGGRDLYFPFGLPQYDERMTFHDWQAPLNERKKPHHHSLGLQSFSRRAGRIWVATTPLDYGDNLWSRLNEEIAQIDHEKAKESQV